LRYFYMIYPKKWLYKVSILLALFINFSVQLHTQLHKLTQRNPGKVFLFIFRLNSSKDYIFTNVSKHRFNPFSALVILSSFFSLSSSFFSLFFLRIQLCNLLFLIRYNYCSWYVFFRNSITRPLNLFWVSTEISYLGLLTRIQ
jgi:hypothetical protein